MGNEETVFFRIHHGFESNSSGCLPRGRMASPDQWDPQDILKLRHPRRDTHKDRQKDKVDVCTWLECSSILYVGALSLWPSDRFWDQISKDSKKSNVGWFFRGGFLGWAKKETMGKPWKSWRGSVSLRHGICFKKISEGSFRMVLIEWCSRVMDCLRERIWKKMPSTYRWRNGHYNPYK